MAGACEQRENRMLNVAHLMGPYLQQTQTFIWQYLRSFQSIKPIVIASSLENLDQFPLPNGKIVLRHGPRFSSSWMMSVFYHRICRDYHGYIKRIMRKNAVKLVHAHFGPYGCSILPAVTALNLPLVTTFHGYDLSMQAVLERHATDYQALFEQGQVFLVEGPSMREKLLHIGCPREKIHIQRIAIDVRDYTPPEKKFISGQKIKLLFVGRFVEKKGLEYALKALASVKKKTDFDFQYRIIGYGELEDHLRQVARDHHIADDIVWLGRRSHAQVLAEMKTCDILLHPSVTAADGDSEGGAPTIILEAQALGLPIISTDHADIPYIARANEAALLAPERDVPALAANIRRLMQQPEIWPTMGARGRANVTANHHVRTEILSLENLYKSLLKNRQNHL